MCWFGFVGVVEYFDGRGCGDVDLGFLVVGVSVLVLVVMVGVSWLYGDYCFVDVLFV